MAQNMMTIYTTAISLFLLDPFLLMQQRSRKKRIIIRHIHSNPLRRQIQRERLRVSRPNRGRPPYTRHQFNLFTKSDNWCLEFLRFTKAQIQELVRAFRLEDLQLRNRCQASPETCLAVLLFRLAFPNRYKSCCDVCVLILINFSFLTYLYFYFSLYFLVIYFSSISLY